MDKNILEPVAEQRHHHPDQCRPRADDPVRTPVPLEAVLDEAPPASSTRHSAPPEAACTEDLELGATTAEYGIVMLAAVGFAGLLVVILKSGEVRELLMGIIRTALSTG